MTILFIGYALHLLNLLMFPVYLVFDEEGLNDSGTLIKWAEIEDIAFIMDIWSDQIFVKYRNEKQKQRKTRQISLYKYSGSNSEIMKTINKYWLKYKEEPTSSTIRL